MKLIKKITFKRIAELPQHKKVLKIFDKFKEDKNIDLHNSIKRTKDASKLNYFFVLEYENILKTKFNFKKMFDKNFNHDNIVNLSKILEEKDKVEKYIEEKKKKEPAFFSKIGFPNEVTGCYLVGTNKKSINYIKDLDLKNKNNLILIKFDYKDLPKEFEILCNEYYQKTQDQLKKERDEIEKFSKLNSEEQDLFINNLLNNINSPSLMIIEGFNLNYNDNYSKNSNFTFYDGFSEHNIQQINNIQFLEALKINAEEKEAFELCAKIRDRLKELKGEI